MAGLSAALLAQQWGGVNVAQQDSLLPFNIGAAAGAAGAGAAALAAPPPPPFPQRFTSGLTIQLTLQGSACGNVSSAGAAGLLGGAFAYSLASSAASGSHTHRWDCPACSFGPGSALPLLLPAQCSLALLGVAAVGVTGDALALSLVVDARGVAAQGGASAASASASPATAPSVQALVSLSTVLEVLQDSVGGRSARGYSLTGGAVSYAAVPASGGGGGGGGLLQLTIALPTAASYRRILLAPTVSLLQLASSIVGLAGLLSVFAFLFGATEDVGRRLSGGSALVRKGAGGGVLGGELGGCCRPRGAPKLQPEGASSREVGSSSSSVVTLNPLHSPQAEE